MVFLTKPLINFNDLVRDALPLIGVWKTVKFPPKLYAVIYLGVLAVLAGCSGGLPWYYLGPLFLLSATASLLFLAHWGRVNTQVSEGEDESLLHTRLFLGWCVGGFLPFVLVAFVTWTMVGVAVFVIAAGLPGIPFVWAYSRLNRAARSVEIDRSGQLVEAPAAIESLQPAVLPETVLRAISEIAPDPPSGVTRLPRVGTQEHAALLARRAERPKTKRSRVRGTVTYLRLLPTGTSR